MPMPLFRKPLPLFGVALGDMPMPLFRKPLPLFDGGIYAGKLDPTHNIRLMGVSWGYRAAPSARASATSTRASA